MFRKVASTDGGARQIAQIIFDRDSKWLASAEIQPNGVSIWDSVTHQGIELLTGYTKGTSSIAINPDNSVLATGSFDGSIKLWQVDGWKLHQTLPANHRKGVTGLAFDLTGTTLVSASLLGQETLIWDVESGKVKQSINKASLRLETAIDLPGNTVAIADKGIVAFFDLITGEFVHAIDDNVDNSPIAISLDGELMACITRDEKVNVWDLKAESLKSTISINRDGASFPVFSPDRTVLAIAHMYSPCITLWNMNAGQEVQLICNEDFGQVKSVCFSEDNTSLACGFESHFSTNSLIELWQRYKT